jgi:HD-like signal output (HDOD) protein
MLPERAVDEDLTEWVRGFVASHTGDIPVFPWVATQLVELVERPDTELAQIEELVGRDAGVSSQLLRTANSALFRGVLPIETVSEAVRRVGLRETKNVALTAACRALFDVEDRAEREVFPQLWDALWHDALLGAYASRLIALEDACGDPELAFAGGLFRNIGSLIVVRSVSRGLVTGELRRQVEADDLEQAVTQLHSEIGAEYLERCGIVAMAVRAAKLHHTVPLRPQHATPELHTVRVADGLIDVLGIGAFPTGQLPVHSALSAEELGLDPERLQYYELQLVGLSEQLEGLI